MCLVALRPVFSLREHLFSSMTTDVRGYPLSLVKDLDGGRCRSNFHAFLHQCVGHAVEVGVEGDVVVDVDAGVGPLAHVERLGGQRSQSVAFDRSEHTGTRSFALPEWSLVQPLEQFANRIIQIPQAKKLLVAWGGKDPAFDDLHTNFDLGLVFRMTGARRHDSHVVVHGKFLIGGVEIRIVAASTAHSRSQVIRNEESGHSRKVFKGMHVSADPGAQLLVPSGFGIRVGTRAQHHHEQRRWPDFAGNRIVHRNRGTGPVHETLLARLVFLAKNYILLSAPTLVEPAEATVAVSFRMNLPVLFPSQLQRQMAMLLQLRMQGGKIRKDLFGESFYHLPLSEQGLLDALLVPLLSERPHHTGCGGPVEVVMNGTLANRTGAGYGPLPQPQLEAEADDFYELTHGQSPGWHSVSPVIQIGETACLL